MSKQTKKEKKVYCKKGTRKNPKTGICEGPNIDENNDKPTLTVTTATAKDLKMDKMKPGPNAEGWFLWPNATNWTVRVGCLDSSGNFSTPSGMTSSQLFDLSN